MSRAQRTLASLATVLTISSTTAAGSGPFASLRSWLERRLTGSSVQVIKESAGVPRPRELLRRGLAYGLGPGRARAYEGRTSLVVPFPDSRVIRIIQGPAAYPLLPERSPVLNLEDYLENFVTNARAIRDVAGYNPTRPKTAIEYWMREEGELAYGLVAGIVRQRGNELGVIVQSHPRPYPADLAPLLEFALASGGDNPALAVAAEGLFTRLAMSGFIPKNGRYPVIAGTMNHGLDTVGLWIHNFARMHWDPVIAADPYHSDALSNAITAWNFGMPGYPNPFRRPSFGWRRAVEWELRKELNGGLPKRKAL